MKTTMATLAATAALVLGGGAAAQDGWRTVDPANLLVIDTSKGRVVVELEPRVAPAHVERIRTLADGGFYDGLVFHRVIPGFMAQTGDPTGTGSGDSDLPDLKAELTFRRGADSGYVPVPAAGANVGLFGSLPVTTQPDAQMMFTVDRSVPANGLFCPGVVGMARSGTIDSANSQFFLMTGRADTLNALYTPFGRILAGHNVVTSIKPGSDADNGRVPGEPDRMTRVRTAAALPAGERPSARVMTPDNPGYMAAIEATRAARGAQFQACDLMPPVEVTP